MAVNAGYLRLDKEKTAEIGFLRSLLKIWVEKTNKMFYTLLL